MWKGLLIKLYVVTKCHMGRGMSVDTSLIFYFPGKLASGFYNFFFQRITSEISLTERSQNVTQTMVIKGQ